MSFDVDEDILQDFLVEAGEILEQLQEQLVDLENNPEDADLLNAIFRGYHTVKGGAGFLSLTELVEICHGAENVFDVMRNGQRTLTPELMDIILQATDVVVEMFERVKARDPLEPADAHLVDLLHKLSRPESPDENIFGEQSAPASEPEPAIEEPELVVEEPTAQAPSSGDSGGITKSLKMSLKRCLMSFMALGHQDSPQRLKANLQRLLHLLPLVITTISPTKNLKRCSMIYMAKASLVVKKLRQRQIHQLQHQLRRVQLVMKKSPMTNLKHCLTNCMAQGKGLPSREPFQRRQSLL